MIKWFGISISNEPVIYFDSFEEFSMFIKKAASIKNRYCIFEIEDIIAVVKEYFNVREDYLVGRKSNEHRVCLFMCVVFGATWLSNVGKRLNRRINADFISDFPFDWIENDSFLYACYLIYQDLIHQVTM